MTTPISNEGSDQLNQLFGVDQLEETAKKKKLAYEKLLEALKDPNLADAVYQSMLNPDPDNDGGPLGLLNMHKNDEVDATDPGSPSNLLFTKQSDETSAT